MGEISRRDLLRGAAAAAAAATLPALGLTACAEPAATPGPGPTTPGAGPALARLPGLVRGDVLFPGDPAYGPARLVWNARYDDRHPQAIVEVADAADVAAVVRFARDEGLAFRVRGGGHSFAGYSTTDAVVIDTRRLTGVALAPGATRAELGAGLTNLEAYRGLWPARAAIPGGTCPTVGLAGLTTGGGLGVLGRRHGLTSDALTGVELVTAAGEVVRADGREHPDLLWATQGGGGGSFGVLTSLTFDLVPVDGPFTLASLAFPWSAAGTVLARWQEWLPGSPRATWAAVIVQTQDPARGEPAVVLDVVHAGDGDGLDAVLADLLGAIGVAPIGVDRETSDFYSIEDDFYCKGFRPEECALADAVVGGRIARPAFHAASNVARGPWPEEGLALVLAGLEARQADPLLTPADFDPGRTVGKVIFEPADGAVHDVAPEATAFVHRDALMVMQYQARWRPGGPAALAEANVAWVADLYGATGPYRSGSAYQNYIDPGLEGWERAYWGANLDRLRRIKAEWDPEDVFRFPQSVRPA